MSRPSAKKNAPPPGSAARRTPPTRDRTIYLGLAIIGLCVTVFGMLVSGRAGWMYYLLAYVAIVLWFMNTGALRIYHGEKVGNMQKALARIPLRPTGYGHPDHHPVEAARNEPAAMKAVVVSSIVSIVFLAALTLWLVPGLRPF